MGFPPSSLENAAPLLDMPSGRKLMVEELTGSPDLRSKLYAMGVLPGTVIERCGHNCAKGSVCVRVRQCSLVLGESLARAIRCSPADGRCPHHGPHRHNHHAWTWFGRGGACPEADGTDILEVRECGCSPSGLGAESGRDRPMKEN